MIDALTAVRVIFVLGIINLVTGLMVYFSCRCLPGSGIGKKLMKYKWYQRYYKWHCRIWYVFWPSVVIHAIFAIIYIGWPF